MSPCYISPSTNMGQSSPAVLAQSVHWRRPIGRWVYDVPEEPDVAREEKAPLVTHIANDESSRFRVTTNMISNGHSSHARTPTSRRRQVWQDKGQLALSCNILGDVSSQSPHAAEHDAASSVRSSQAQELLTSITKEKDCGSYMSHFREAPG